MTESTAVAVLPISPSILQTIMPRAPMRFLGPLNSAMARFHIDTGKRVAGFLSQLAEESNQLQHHHELAALHKNFKLPGVKRPPYSATSKQDYFEYWYGNRPDLGNLTVGDGFTFRGRGAIQVTGRKNYRAIGQGIGRPLEANPDLLTTDDGVNMEASAFFFARVARLNPVADRVEPSDDASIYHVNGLLTRRINGGVNGLAARHVFYRRALKVLLG